MHDRVTLGRRTLLIVVQYVLGSLVGLVCLWLSTRYFSEAVVGLVLGVGFSSFHLLVFFSDLGLRQAHMSLVQSRDSGECNSSYLLSKLLLCSLMSFLFLTIIALSDARNDVMLVFLFCAVLFTLRDIPIGIFDSRIESVKSQSAIVVEHIARLILTVIFSLLAMGKGDDISAIYLSMTFLLSMLASVLFSYVFLRGYPFGRPKHMRAYFALAPGIAFIGGMDIIMLNVDKIALQFFVSAEALGVYTGVNKLAQLMFYLSTALITVLLPTVAMQDDESAVRSTAFAERYLTMIVIPVTLLAIALRREVIGVLLSRESYLGGEVALVILLIATMLLSISRSEAILLFGKGRKGAILINMVLAFMYVSLTMVLSYLFSANGAAMAALISGVFAFLAFRYACKREFEKPVFDNHLKRQFLSGMAAFIAVAVLNTFGISEELKFLFFLFLIATGTIIYLVSLLLTKELNLDDLAYAIELIRGRK